MTHRLPLPEAVLEEMVIPVARGLSATTAGDLVSALAAGGITSIEITVEGGGGFGAIEAASEISSTVGAGTVTSVDLAVRAVQAGAAFVVTPHLSVEVIEWCVRTGIPIVAGGFTPTEVAAAWEAGASAVKVFPAGPVGPGWISALRGPYGDVAFIPTGGVSGDNARSFIDAGAVAVGVGGWLTSHDDWTLVTQRALALRAAVVL